MPIPANFGPYLGLAVMLSSVTPVVVLLPSI